MTYFFSIFIRDLKSKQFFDLINQLEKFGTKLEQTEKNIIVGANDDLGIVNCLFKMKETHPDGRFGVSQYSGLARGLSKIAQFGEILISEEIEQSIIEDFEITSLGMLTIEGMKSQILVCRVDRPLKNLRFPEIKGEVKHIPRAGMIDALQNLLKVSRWVLVYGPPGSGKSVFMDMIAEKWSMDKYVFRTTCMRYVPNLTLKPLFDVAVQILGLDLNARIEEKQRLIEKRLREIGIRDIGTTYLAILDFLEIGDEETILEKMNIKMRVEIIVNSIAEIIRRISYLKPTALIIEDVENMDLSSVNFMQTIMQKLADENVLFVYTSMQQQVSIQGLREFELMEITQEQLEEHVQSFIGERLNLPTTTAFHISQFLSLYREEKNVFFHNQYEGGSSLVNFSLPFNDIKSIIKRRVELLDNSAEFLFALAAFGQEIDPREFPMEQKAAHQFEFFVQRKFLKRFANRYCFVSPQLHEELYNMMTDKQSRHARLADYYRRLEGYEEYAAFHFQNAENYKKAVEFLLKSAKLALKRGGYESAKRYYNQALDLCRREKDLAELETLVAINEGLADIFRALGDEEMAMKYYKVVLDSYKEILKE